MHILFLTDNFYPEVNAPASRTYDHCQQWVKQGHEVTVVTSVPNFPLGRVYEGYKNKWWQQETLQGIKIIRVKTYMAENKGFIKRILDYLSFMLMAIVASVFVKKVDVIIGTSPQFFTVCAAYVVSKLKKCPWVFELRDFWPESIKAVGVMRDSILITVLEKIEQFLYRKADLIIVVTHTFKKILQQRGIAAEKIIPVTNGVDLEQFFPEAKCQTLLADLGLQQEDTVVGYIGTHGLAHDLFTVLQAAAWLQARPQYRYVKFLFIGEGASKKELEKYALQQQLGNVIFLDAVGKEEISRYWSILDVSLIHLRNTPLFSSVIPSKLFESMGKGIPVLHGVKGESADIVTTEAVGCVFEPGDAEALVDALLTMIRDQALMIRCKENCQQAALKYDRNQLAQKMLQSVQEVLQP